MQQLAEPRGNRDVRSLLRTACAGVALIAITALTSVGLYAIVVGGLMTPGPTGRSPMGGVPVLVTIQAGPATTTPAAVASETPSVSATNVARPAPASTSAPAQSVANPGAIAPGTAEVQPRAAIA